MGPGLKPEVAATKTWTGELATGAGLEVKGLPVLEGTPGNYTDVDVIFGMPGPGSAPR